LNLGDDAMTRFMFLLTSAIATAATLASGPPPTWAQKVPQGQPQKTQETAKSTKTQQPQASQKTSTPTTNLSREGARALARKLAEQFVHAYNDHDVKAVMALHAEQVQRITTRGRESRTQNRAEIEKSLTDIFKQYPKIKLKVEPASADYATPQVLTSEGTFELSDGPADQVNKGRYTVTRRKYGDRWLIFLTQIGSQSERATPDRQHTK
jgi:uncharacterized protein (TIGR02246 family)